MNEKDKFGQVLQEIIRTYGMEILQDARRVNALLMDYVPSQSRERRMIVSALESGIGNNLLKAVNQNEQEQQVCITRCIRSIIEESWVTKEAAQFAVYVLACSLGIKNQALEQPESQSQQQSVAKVFEKGVAMPANKSVKDVLVSYEAVGYKAFASNLILRELTLPDSIKIIKSKAFVDCIYLKSITLSSAVEAIGVDAFIGCNALETIVLSNNPNYTVVGGMLIDKKKKSLMRATRSVAQQCVVPREVREMHGRAFEQSEVQSVVLPRTLEKLAGNTFYYCEKLQKINVDPHNDNFSSVEGVLHTKDRKRLVRFPSGYDDINYIMEDTVSYIDDGAFSTAVNLETITFTSSLKSIGSRAFEYCQKLSTLMLPSSVEIIGERAFQYCEQLFSVMLPRSIQEIGDYAFCGCKSIQTISVPKNVTRIGHAAFKDCASLNKIIIQDQVSFIGDGAFIGCADDLEIAIRHNDYVEKYCAAHKIPWVAI